MLAATLITAFALLLPAATLLDHGPDDEAAIRRARTHSNRAIVNRNLLGVAESLADDYVAIVGDGGFVSSKKEYVGLFKQDFDSGSKRVIYERVADKIEVNAEQGLAAEHGHWIGRRVDGSTAFTGTYMAMWQQTPAGWKIRSELFVTLSTGNQPH
ncbi:Ketosteroid isomerase homolog [Bryocella elongata]|uniref:Ketosteroid isomerase homolog n=1 Tax=Bryocella elongata TaxID=863522 RepID=A0A1H5WHX6_9BACT|nr:nuclear transport factor 2 family protein [Bryocella elongata]SEF99072.1 Ketosteroid isomerase homolog [Bryocella elongata]